jgi:hypothetical protein
MQDDEDEPTSQEDEPTSQEDEAIFNSPKLSRADTHGSGPLSGAAAGSTPVCPPIR